MKNELMIFERREQAVVSSRVIAERFGKRHYDVVCAIEGKRCLCQVAPCARCKGSGFLRAGLFQEINEKSRLSKMFTRSSFEDSMGRPQKEYLLNRDGFSLLVMGFTGSDALAWKLKYISAFNAMEAFIRERLSSEWLMTRKQGKLVRRGETDTIANLIDYAKAQGSRSADKMYIVLSLDNTQSSMVQYMVWLTVQALEKWC